MESIRSKTIQSSFPRSNPLHSAFAQTYTPTHLNIDEPPLFFQQAPPPMPIPAPSPNPFTIFQKGSNNPPHQRQSQQHQTLLNIPGFFNPPNPFASINQIQYPGAGQKPFKPTKSHNKRSNNQKSMANQPKRFQGE
jgi:hypothetical protein